jgi:hypothetical protein
MALLEALLDAFIVFCICGVLYTALEVSYHALFDEDEEDPR